MTDLNLWSVSDKKSKDDRALLSSWRKIANPDQDSIFTLSGGFLTSEEGRDNVDDTPKETQERGDHNRLFRIIPDVRRAPRLLERLIQHRQLHVQSLQPAPEGPRSIGCKTCKASSRLADTRSIQPCVQYLGFCTFPRICPKEDEARKV